jgi:hypothetical protein
MGFLNQLDNIVAAASKAEMKGAVKIGMEKEVSKLGKKGLWVNPKRQARMAKPIRPAGMRIPKKAPKGAPKPPRAPNLGPINVGGAFDKHPAIDISKPRPPRTGWNKHAHDAASWAKGHKKIVAGAGAVAIAGTAISNASGPGSPKGTPVQARGIYGF